MNQTLIAATSHSLEDVRNGFFIVGGIMLVIAFVSRRLVGVGLVVAGAVAAYAWRGGELDPNVPTQQYGLLFMGAIAGFAAVFLVPKKAKS
jgi:hypothetical protein